MGVNELQATRHDCHMDSVQTEICMAQKSQEESYRSQTQALLSHFYKLINSLIKDLDGDQMNLIIIIRCFKTHTKTSRVFCQHLPSVTYALPHCPIHTYIRIPIYTPTWQTTS